MSDAIIDGYQMHADDLIGKFEAVSPSELYAPVQEFLSREPCRILDVGAGTGRDAAWFSAAGHSVVAVEPVQAFREAGGAKYKDHDIQWIDDTLPDLSQIVAQDQTFDCIILSAVWQHLNDNQRQRAMPNLRQLTRTGGTLILSLRHGDGAPSRPIFPANVCDVELWAQKNRFSIPFEIPTPSVQKDNQIAGVKWTWLVFRASD